MTMPNMHLIDSKATPLCPICSPELSALARNLPYSQHSRNIVDDPVALPSGRVYSESQLREWCYKHKVGIRKLRDPATGDEFDESKLRKIYT